MLVQKAEIDVNVEEIQDGCTALNLASFGGYADIVELLLQQENLDTNVGMELEGHFMNANDIAEASGHENIVEMLARRQMFGFIN